MIISFPKVTAVLRKTISQKRIPPRLAVVLFSKVYFSKLSAEYKRREKKTAS